LAKISREALMAEARKKVKKAYSSRDRLLIHTVSSVSELDKTINLFYERLVEWYAIYFPEFNHGDPRAYCEVVLFLDKDKPDKHALTEALGHEKAEKIVKRAQQSMGSELKPEDLEQMRSLANEVLSLYALRDSIEDYQASIIKELAPNLGYLVEPKLAAGLIAQAGSLERLAKMPASTIQVLGAEKALFKHLRQHTQPPKHGLIFQFPDINNAPLQHRGKLARALATKLAMAAKADAITHEFIAEKLKKNFEKRAAEIKTLPIKQRKKPKPEKGRPMQRGRRGAWKRQKRKRR